MALGISATAAWSGTGRYGWRWLAAAAVAAIAGLLLLACEAGEPAADPSGAVFRFSAIPDEKPTEQRARFQPVADYLAERLGVPVEYVPVNQYAASVQAFVNGDVHAAWFGGLSGVQARQAVPGSSVLAQGAEDPSFYSYFIAHVDSGLERAPEFPLGARGTKFSFGSEGSTSGRLMPEHFIRLHTGSAPEDFFDRVGYSGNHPATLAAVNSGAFDVGALNYRVYDDAPDRDKANTFVLWRTPPYADYNLSARPDLDARFGAGFTAELERAFLAMPGELCQRSFGRSRMIAARAADFADIEATARQLGLVR